MATIASLDTRLGVDASDLTRGLQRGAADLTRFAGAAESVIAALPGLDVSQFFAGVEAGAADALREMGLLGQSAQSAAASLAEIPPAISAIPAAATKAANAADVLIAKLGLVKRNADGIGNVLAVPNTAGSAQQVAVLAGALQRVPPAAAQSAASLSAWDTAVAEASAQSAVLSKEVRANLVYSERQAAAAAQVAAATDGGTRALTGHHTATRRATTAIAQLAATSIGAEGPVARLAESALLFGGGEAAVVGVASGVLALAVAYRFVTTAQREAEETQSRYVDGLLTEANQAVPSAVKAAEALTAALEAQRRAREGLLSRAATAVGGVVATVADPGALGVAAANEIQRRNAKDSVVALRATQQAQDDFTKSVRDFEDVNVKAITESIQLGTADNFLRAQAPGLVKLLRDRIADQATTTQAAAAAQQLLNGLLDAMSKKDVGDAFVQGLALQVALFGETELAAKKVAIALNTDLTPAQKAQAVALASTLDGMERQKKALEEHKKEIDALLKGATLPPIQEGLQQAVDALDVALKGPHPVEIFLDTREADKQLEEFLKKLQQKQKADDKNALGLLDAPGNGIRDSFDQAQASVADVNDELTRGAELSDAFFRHASRGNAGLANAVRDVTSGLDQVVGAAVNVGLIGDEAANAIGSVLNLADALGSVAEKASTGNIAALVGAGISVLGAVFGKSQAEIEHERRLEDNTRAIEHNTVVQGRQGQAITSAAVNQGIDDAIAAEATRRRGPKGHEFDTSTATANRALAASGLDVQDLAEIAARNHINILDKNGNIDPEALAQWNAALDSGKIQLLGLGDAADSVTNALLNVPEGFKIASARFNATQAVPEEVTVDEFATRFHAAHPDAFSPADPRLTGFDAVTADSRSPSSGTSTMNVEKIEIHINGRGKSDTELADTVLDRLQRRAMFGPGRSVDWSSVN